MNTNNNDDELEILYDSGLGCTALSSGFLVMLLKRFYSRIYNN